MAIDGPRSVRRLRKEGIVCATQHPDIARTAIAAQGKRLVVVELEARTLAATRARRVDEGAAISVPLRDGSFHGCGNVTGAR